jgi:4-amino-4-deoxy-L-arabinose transferase-like glycosyltransferase
VLLVMGCRFSTLLLPPHGEHAWRDADGIGVARSFLHQGYDILVPRVVERGAGSGVVGMEFPLVNWLGAVFMGLSSESDVAARLPVWLCVPLLGAGMWALSRRLLASEREAYVAAVFVVLQPLVLLFSHKLMPEVPMVTLLCWGLVFAFQGFFDARPVRAWLFTASGAGCLALAAVLKPTGVAVVVPIVSWFAQGVRGKSGSVRWNLVARLALLAALPVAAVVVWFRHAQRLDIIGGSPLFHLRQDFWEWTHLIYTWPFFSVVFARCIHLFLLWPTVIFMAWRWRALLRVLRRHAMLGVWFLVNLAFVVTLGGHYFHHYYYALPLVLPVGALVGAFVAEATEETRRPDLFATLFLGVIALTSIIRTTAFMPPLTFDATRLSQALAKLGPQGPTVVTDETTPVVSLVTLRRTGWGVPAKDLSPERIADFRRKGATLLVESSVGGWLPEATRAMLPSPLYVDDQVRSYVLKP